MQQEANTSQKPIFSNQKKHPMKALSLNDFLHQTGHEKDLPPPNTSSTGSCGQPSPQAQLLKNKDLCLSERARVWNATGVPLWRSFWGEGESGTCKKKEKIIRSAKAAANHQ